MMEQSFQPSPDLLFDTALAYQRSAALKGAVDLNLFTAIGELDAGNQSAAGVADIAARCGAAERGVRILCDYMVINGFLTKQGQSYGLTPDSAAFLDRRSPAYMGSMLNFLLDPSLVGAHKDVAATVRKGGTVMEDQGTVSSDHPIWVEFARAMAPAMALPAQLIVKVLQSDSAHPLEANKKLKVLDLAAGHGIFGITLAQHYPQAEIVATDWPHVLEVASENAQNAGVEQRFSTIPGSAFEVDFGSGYDIVLITNFLHHFDPATNETLLKKIHAALAPEGCAVTLEFVPNEDRITPPQAAAFSFTMLSSTPSGDAYTFPELESMLQRAGFSQNEIHALPPSFQQVIISYK